MGLPKLGSLVAGQYVSPRLFRSQLDYLNARDWAGGTLSETTDSSIIPDQDRFAVTFDDGYRGVYEHACPALTDRNLTATIYVVAGSIGGINDWDRRAGDQSEPMMTAGQIRELADHGFRIGSHTMTHPHLTELTDEQLRAELANSKHVLEDIIGTEVAAFSYPYGDYDNRVLEEVVAAGYSSAVATKLGVITLGVRAFEIPRVNVRWNAIGPLLMRKINRARKASGLAK
ncbi:MAG: hypothetical protein A2Z18_04505 [Armatimonadetes bacterium RBG_16_58_9]|nr:MAG: hypothetical protein A2Z18_04505 [Armatimonadetes bacterium RBG_16_58_9]